MEDILWTSLVFVFGLAVHSFILRFHDRRVGKFLTIAFLAHVASGIAQVLLVLHYFEGGDMLNYFQSGVPAAELLRDDFVRFAPELARAFFRDADYLLPTDLFGTGSTLSMSALSAGLLYVTGNSLYGVSALIGLGSYVSSVLVYHALRGFLPERLDTRVLIGSTLLPSAVFWSSALLKEPIVFCGIGPILLGLTWILKGTKRPLAVIILVSGAVLVATIKPYVLMALSVSTGVFYLWSRLFASGRLTIRPLAVVMAFAVGTAGLVLGFRYFEKGRDGISATTLASQRHAGYTVSGGSDFSIEDSEDRNGRTSSRSFVNELALAPLALATAFFRPVLIEVRSAIQLVNALEATFLLIVFIRVLRARGLRQTLQLVRSSPVLMFCVAFSFALALGTGLTTTNMGTLSRYRAPMMPFFFTLLLVLDARDVTEVDPSLREGRYPRASPSL